MRGEGGVGERCEKSMHVFRRVLVALRVVFCFVMCIDVRLLLC
jgi:hypothetical protein